MMRTILTGRPSKRHHDLHAVALDAHAASAAELKPGNTFGDVFDAYAKVIDKAGHLHLTATGYSLGATFPPSWMDWPMFWHGNDTEIRPGMVLFIHTVVTAKNKKITTAPGQTYIVTRNGAESLSKLSMELVVNV
jgi:Xaa-Pro dipeptidase